MNTITLYKCWIVKSEPILYEYWIVKSESILFYFTWDVEG